MISSLCHLRFPFLLHTIGYGGGERECCHEHKCTSPLKRERPWAATIFDFSHQICVCCCCLTAGLDTSETQSVTLSSDQKPLEISVDRAYVNYTRHGQISIENNIVIATCGDIFFLLGMPGGTSFENPRNRAGGHLLDPNK